jgi:hypothetical protein
MHAGDFRGCPSRLFNRNISKNRRHTRLQDFFLEESLRLERLGSRQMGAE